METSEFDYQLHVLCTRVHVATTVQKNFHKNISIKIMFCIDKPQYRKNLKSVYTPSYSFT